jgi:class 3 adenylate cyclase
MRIYAVVVPGSGTVTLLFTDLVGSTESLVALGEDRYDSVRDEHEVLVAGTIAAYHGEVVKSTGDGLWVPESPRGLAVRVRSLRDSGWAGARCVKNVGSGMCR